MTVMLKRNGPETHNLFLILQLKPNHMRSNMEMKRHKELQRH